MAKRVDYKIVAQFEDMAEGEYEIKTYEDEDEDDELLKKMGAERKEEDSCAWVSVQKRVKGGKYKEIAWLG